MTGRCAFSDTIFCTCTFAEPQCFLFFVEKFLEDIATAYLPRRLPTATSVMFLECSLLLNPPSPSRTNYISKVNVQTVICQVDVSC